jgi:TorA maturation chaperone TorD
MSASEIAPELSVEVRNTLDILAQDLQLLARVHDREMDPQALTILRSIGFPSCLALELQDSRGQDAITLLEQSLQHLYAPGESDLDELAVDYADIYLNHSIQASPFESVWLDEDGLAMQQPMFQIREWYGRFGMSAEDWRIRSDDHIGLQLQFLAHLLARAGESGETLQVLGELARFMDEHPLRWIDEFSQRVTQRCGTAFYAGSALLTASYLEALRGLLEMVLDQPRPSTAEIEERMKPRAEPVEVPLTYMPGTSASW